MTPARQDLTIYRGIDFNPIVITATNGSGGTVDLTGWTAYAAMRNGYGKPVDLSPTISNAAAGQITLSFTKDETSDFNIGANEWNLYFQRPNGQRIGPYISGIVTVKDKVDPP